MVEMKNNCDSCVHNNVCKYAKDFKIMSNSIAEAATESVHKECFQNRVRLAIHCKRYVMATHQEAKTNLHIHESL